MVKPVIPTAIVLLSLSTASIAQSTSNSSAAGISDRVAERLQAAIAKPMVIVNPLPTPTGAPPLCSGSTAVDPTDPSGYSYDTVSFMAALLTANKTASPDGVELVLPTGKCEINGELDFNPKASIRITGAGIGATQLEFFTAPNAAPVMNGLVIKLTGNTVAAVDATLDDFSINRRSGANSGQSNFYGNAISVLPASTSNTYNLTSTISNLSIFPSYPGGQTDSWNTGILEQDMTAPVISNVTVNMPGWAILPDPSGYQCTSASGTVNCAIHALPSPANPVSTPGNLGFGVATAVALEGTGQVSPSKYDYQVDTTIDGLDTAGGLVGIDFATAQGLYVTNAKLTSGVYGIRADTLNTTSEEIAVSNSLFQNTVGGIYVNGVGGVQVTGNYFSPGDTGTSNLPDWAAIWIRSQSNFDTLSGNNIGNEVSSVNAEYGIFISDSNMITETGNNIDLNKTPGTTCLANDQQSGAITSTGNSLESCYTFLSDPTGSNGYSDNTFQYASEFESSNDAVTFTQPLTIGAANSNGGLDIVTQGVQKFLIDSSGDATASGSITAAGAVSGNSLTTNGPLLISGNSGHNAAQEVVGNFYYPAQGNPTTITLNAPTGAFPAFTGGVATIFGELTCSANAGANNAILSWHVDGHYVIKNSAVTITAFSAAPEGDNDTVNYMKTLTGTNSVTPIGNPSALGLQVQFGAGVSIVYDCTSVLTEMVDN